MYRNKLILAGLSALLITGAAGASFAASGERPDRPRHHQMMGGPRAAAFREILFVRMLKQFDADKDNKISKQEAIDGVDKVFAAADKNNDGSLTPGEIRDYRQTQIKAWRAAHKDAGKNGGDDQQMSQNDGKRPQHKGMDGHRWGKRHGGDMMFASMMRRVDKDENGQISKQEAEDAMTRLFTRLDTNKDGFISIDDMPDRPFL